MRPLSSSPEQEQHTRRCVLCNLCRELWRGCAQVCTSVFRVCTVCARVSVSVVHGVHSVQNVLSPDGGFQRVFCEVCAHLQNVSDSVAELDAPREQVDGSEICARVRKKQLRTGFQPVEQKRNRRQIRELFPSGAVRGRIWPDLAKSGAPAAILINAYSGDFCHPVLSNALAQEPLVYHSGTRELFSDIFGTFSEISTFSSFSSNLTKTVKNEKHVEKHNFTCSRTFAKENSQTRTMFEKTFSRHAKLSANVQNTNVQMCKCAKNRRAQNAQICSAHFSANANFCTVHNFCKCNFHISAHVTISANANFSECKFFFVFA